MSGGAVDYLFSLQNRGIKLDLGRMRAALEELERPQDAFDSILVAGTNGKGSTASALASILQRPGHRVGLFTSPHLVDYRERFRIDARMVSAPALEARVLADREIWEHHHLTYFEATVALALALFRDAAVQTAVLEVGLGGRLDATNVAEPILSVITPIGYDHMHILGESLDRIAGEKAGVLREGVPAVLASGFPEAVRALRESALRVNAPEWLRSRLLHVRGIELLSDVENAGGSRFSIRPRSVESDAPSESASISVRKLFGDELVCEIALPGVHQVANASLAALAACAISARSGVKREHVRDGLRRWRWPGRLERPRPDLPLLFDCGHNREGGRSLASALSLLAPRGSIELVVGMVDKKDHEAFFREVRRVTSRVRIAPPRTERAASREALESAARRAGFAVERSESIASGLDDALAAAEREPGKLVVLAGSLFTLEDGYHALGTAPAELLWEPSVQDPAAVAHAHG
jgi:dihydrofolate synthase/folylpolyglutamate synthase